MRYLNILAFSSLTVLASSSSPNSVPSAANPVSHPTVHPIFPRTIHKRTEPNTEEDSAWPSEAALENVEDAFKAVIELSSYAVTVDIDDDSDSAIWRKYFGPNDNAKVKAVFNAIMGNPTDPLNPDPTGADALGKIFVQHSDPGSDCASGLVNAVMLDWNVDSPIILICDLGLTQKRLWDVGCSDLGPNVSYKFMTLAGTMLHEYTHWSDLTKSIVGGDGIVDQDNLYGVWNAQNFAKTDTTKALTNADNYAYYASEVFYSTICSTSYNPPVKGVDDEDPSCDDAPCQA